VIEQLRAKLRSDLDWRGPNGKRMAHVVMSREQAWAIVLLLDMAPPEVSRALDLAKEVKR